MVLYRTEILQGTKTRYNKLHTGSHPGQVLRKLLSRVDGLQSEFLSAHIVNDQGYAWRYILRRKNGRYEARLSRRRAEPLPFDQTHAVMSGAILPHKVI